MNPTEVRNLRKKSLRAGVSSGRYLSWSVGVAKRFKRAAMKSEGLAAEAAEMPGRDSAACQRDERDARSSSRDWAQYNAAQKSQCAAFAALDRAPSYVELLTCLEMAKQAQELPPDSKADTVGRK